MENLEDIKTGDIVVLENRFGGQIRVVNKIEKLISLDVGVELVFTMNGKEHNGVNRIRKATPDEKKKFEETLVKDGLSESLSHFCWGVLSLEQLQKVYELINQ